MSPQHYPREGMGEIDLQASTLECEDGVEECTIFPRTLGCEDDRRSMWLTARGDDFVNCQEMR
jgi:hypothetical protein